MICTFYIIIVSMLWRFLSYFSLIRSMVLAGIVYLLWWNNTLNFILENSLVILVICIYSLLLYCKRFYLSLYLTLLFMSKPYCYSYFINMKNKWDYFFIFRWKLN